MATSEEDTNLSSWSQLTDDLFHEITNRLDNSSDYVRFGAVCKEWLLFTRENYKDKHLLHSNQQLPLLLIPTQHESRGLYSVTKGMVYDELQLRLPYKRCCGSSHGWLFFVDNESTLELILLNPFLSDSETIRLPPIQFCSEDEVEEMDQYGVRKAVLSKDPYVSPHDFEVIALYGGYAKLAHYKSGDKFWSYAKSKREIFVDVIFYNGLIYAVDNWNWIVSITLESVANKGSRDDTNCSPWCLKLKTLSKRETDSRKYAGNAYLVESSNGDLLLARRYFWDEDERAAREAAKQEAEEQQEHKEFDENKCLEEAFAKPILSVNFKVYRLSSSSKTGGKLRMKKLRMKTLHGETLFLGDNHSICVSTSKYVGIQPNSIYYTDDNTDIYPVNLHFGSCDTGLFNIEDGSFGKHYVPSISTKGMPPPIFVVPRCRYA